MRVRVAMTILAITAFAFALALSPSAASARQHLCTSHEEMLADLTDNWNESLVFQAITQDGRVFELFAAPDGNWTTVFTTTGGWACYDTIGEHITRDVTPLKEGI